MSVNQNQPNEAKVQLADDSANAGKNVRNIALPVLQGDGTVAYVNMQVVVPVNPDGTVADIGGVTILAEVQKQTRLLVAIVQLLESALERTAPEVHDLFPNA